MWPDWTAIFTLGWLVTHRFRLNDYERAFDLLLRRGRSEAIKVTFEFDP